MSWYQLLAMRDQLEDSYRTLLASCPNDGEPLRSGPDGQLYCLFDGERFAAGTLADEVISQA